MGFIICMLAFKFNPRKIDQVRCCSYHGTINAVGKRKAQSKRVATMAQFDGAFFNDKLNI